MKGEDQQPGVFGQLQAGLALNQNLDFYHFQRMWQGIFTEDLAVPGSSANCTGIIPSFSFPTPMKCTLTIAWSAYPVLGCFREYFLSCRLGWVKPEPQIFQHVIRSIGLPPRNWSILTISPNTRRPPAGRGWSASPSAPPRICKKNS